MKCGNRTESDEDDEMQIAMAQSQLEYESESSMRQSGGVFDGGSSGLGSGATWALKLCNVEGAAVPSRA
ncbi:hypothetical protein E2562_025865 [Oryza meyeriana var. granulata]|uniref:Uncharacterized protein n=1 Tax=Oryza meyeriana var. granulata TaxID=110450 RepID=A0A6G1BYS6_9ORYZ|nr:hypothetical protein E2562_025865 [Oryza meyeriana var. granulata]